MKFTQKWKRCDNFRNNTYKGLASTLAGCVVFWNLRNILKKQTDKKEIYNTIPQIVNLAIKSLGVYFFLKAVEDYKRCKI